MTPQSLLLVTFLVFLVGGAIGAPPHQSKIMFGSKLDISKVPWQVVLPIGETFCGGVIVNDRWILTAAHCTKDLLASEIKVRAGSNFRDREGDEYDVELIVPHPDYNALFHNDISALRTSTPIRLGGGTVKSVKLPQQDSTSPPLNTTLTVTGWGRTETGKASDSLKTADVVVTDFQKCLRAFFGFPDESISICAESGDGIDCGGDSGGPVMMGDVLVGLVSLGDKDVNHLCCGVSAYTKVSVFRDWIDQVTRA